MSMHATEPEGAAATAAPAGPAATRGRRSRPAMGELLRRHGALAALALVVLVASLSLDGFLTFGNIGNIAMSAVFLAVIALGMTFVIVTGGIDLSVGTVFALGGVLAAWASQYGTLAALALPLLVCGAIGTANGLLIAKAGLEPFIVTLAALLGAWGLMLAVSDEGGINYRVADGLLLTELAQGRLLGVGYPVIAVAVLFALGAVLLRRTGFGQNVYAIGGNADAAALMGVPVARTTVLVYAMSGLLAGLSGALNAAYLGSGVTLFGIGIELQAISAVVIGGTLLTGGYGFVLGSLVGVLLLKSIQNVINQIGSLDSAYQQIVNGAFLIVVVLLQSFLSRRRGR